MGGLDRNSFKLGRATEVFVVVTESIEERGAVVGCGVGAVFSSEGVVVVVAVVVTSGIAVSVLCGEGIFFVSEEGGEGVGVGLVVCTGGGIVSVDWGGECSSFFNPIEEDFEESVSTDVVFSIEEDEDEDEDNAGDETEGEGNGEGEGEGKGKDDEDSESEGENEGEGAGEGESKGGGEDKGKDEGDGVFVEDVVVLVVVAVVVFCCFVGLIGPFGGT